MKTVLVQKDNFKRGTNRKIVFISGMLLRVCLGHTYSESKLVFGRSGWTQSWS